MKTPVAASRTRSRVQNTGEDLVKDNLEKPIISRLLRPDQGATFASRLGGRDERLGRHRDLLLPVHTRQRWEDRPARAHDAPLSAATSSGIIPVGYGRHVARRHTLTQRRHLLRNVSSGPVPRASGGNMNAHSNGEGRVDASPVDRSAHHTRAVAGMAEPASAAPVTTITHEKGLVETFVGVINGCDESGPLYTVTLTSNLVTRRPSRTTAPSTGRSTSSRRSWRSRWTRTCLRIRGVGRAGGLQRNTSTFISVFTFSLTLNGSDGSKYSENEMIHFNERPDGTQNFFGRCNNRS